MPDASDSCDRSSVRGPRWRSHTSIAVTPRDDPKRNQAVRQHSFGSGWFDVVKSGSQRRAVEAHLTERRPSGGQDDTAGGEIQHIDEGELEALALARVASLNSAWPVSAEDSAREGGGKACVSVLRVGRQVEAL